MNQLDYNAVLYHRAEMNSENASRRFYSWVRKYGKVREIELRDNKFGKYSVIQFFGKLYS